MMEKKLTDDVISPQVNIIYMYQSKIEKNTVNNNNKRTNKILINLLLKKKYGMSINCAGCPLSLYLP